MEEEDEMEEEEEEELESVRVSETEFNFLDFVKRYSTYKVGLCVAKLLHVFICAHAYSL